MRKTTSFFSFTVQPVFLLTAILCAGSPIVFGQGHGKELIAAIQSEDVTALNQLLPEFEDIDHPVEGRPLLHYAARNGSLKMTTYLLEKGADPNATTESLGTALMSAAYFGHEPVLKALLEAGARDDIENTGGYEAFDWALEGSQKGCMLLLLKARAARLDERSRAWLTAGLNGGDAPKMSLPTDDVASLTLLAAVIRDDWNSVSTLLAAGLDLNKHNHTGYAPLPMAVRLNQVAMIEKLLAAGADPSIGNNGNDEAIPLNQAARGGHLHLVELLLGRGANVNKANARGYTALHLAVAYQRLEVARLLLDRGADRTMKNDNGSTAFDFAYDRPDPAAMLMVWLDGLEAGAAGALESDAVNEFGQFSKDPGFVFAAVMRGNQVVLDHALAAGLDPNTRQPGGYPLLSVAARFGHLNMVEVLLAKGAEVDAVSTSGYQTTALMDAGREGGHLEIAKLLLDRGAEIRKGDVNSDPVINWATYYGHKDLVAVLLARGADPTQANKDDYTAVRTAKTRNHAEIIQLLDRFLAEQEAADKLVEACKSENASLISQALKNLPNPNILTKDRQTPLVAAVSLGNVDVVAELIRLGADVNLPSRAGYNTTPLMAATVSNRIAIAKLLLAAAADPLKKDILGDPAINWASYFGHVDMVALLLESGADPKVVTVHGDALGIAMRRGNPELVQLLKPHFVEQQEEPELIGAILAGNEKSVKKRLKKGDSADLVDRLGTPAIILAVQQDKAEIVDLLLSHNVDIEATDRIGFSALMVAARDGKHTILGNLIKWGADLNQAAKPEGMGATPVILAATAGQEQSLSILAEAGADLNKTDVIGNTALLWALSEGKIDAAKRLIELGADPNIANHNGYTAVAVAKAQGLSEKLRLTKD